MNVADIRAAIGVCQFCDLTRVASLENPRRQLLVMPHSPERPALRDLRELNASSAFVATRQRYRGALCGGKARQKLERIKKKKSTNVDQSFGCCLTK